LFLRRWLSREDGEAPSAVQAAAWVDVKRTYLELRPELRRVYLTLRDLAPYGAVATQLGFQVLADLEARVGDSTFYTAMLDFGPGSVDGWICNLLAAELGITEDRLIDASARELIAGDQRIPLTPLEYSLVSMLEARAGEPVSRSELLREVWGHGYEGGSNVVDALVRGLRKKCGDSASIIETVRGVGYRLRT
jgi:cyanate lyase